MATYVLIGCCTTLIFYGIYNLHRFLQGNEPLTTYHQEFDEHRVYTATDCNGDFIEYRHPYVVNIIVVCTSIMGVIIGRLLH